MAFGSLSEFFSMGGHGVYVWLVYGLAAAVIITITLLPVLRRRQFIRFQAMRLRREQQQRQSASAVQE